MKKFASIVMLAGLGLATSGCSMLAGMFGFGGVDLAESIKDSPAIYEIQLHDDAQEGQYWEYEQSGMTVFWGVTGTKDGNLVVENRMTTAQGSYTTAYIVELDGTVTDAYIANYDPDAEELSEGIQLKIMERPEPGKAGEAPETTEGTETLNVAGEDWDCKWIKMTIAGNVYQTWTCDNAWFDKVIKSEASGKVSRILTKKGENATLGLKWPGEGD